MREVVGVNEAFANPIKSPSILCEYQPLNTKLVRVGVGSETAEPFVTLNEEVTTLPPFALNEIAGFELSGVV